MTDGQTPTHNSSLPVTTLLTVARDGHLRSVDEIFAPLVGPTKQIAFNDEQAALESFSATLPDVDPTNGALTGLMPSLHAGPTLGAIPRLNLRTEQKRLLPHIQSRLGIGIDFETRQCLRIINQSRQNDGMTSDRRAVAAGSRIELESNSTQLIHT